MAGKKKADQPQTEEKPQEVQDQPQRDIFDEDEENTGGPPTLNQDGPEKPQDAPGEVPTQVADNPSVTGEVAPVDPEKPVSEGQHTANEALLDAKGDLAPQQPIFDPAAGVFQGFSFNGQPVNRDDPAFKQFLRDQFTQEMAQQGEVQVPQDQTTVKPKVEVRPFEDNKDIQGLSAVRGERPRTFRVTRGKVGQHAEGSIVLGLAGLGLKEEADLARLVNAGVVEELNIS